MQLDVFNLQCQKVDKVELTSSIFGLPARTDLLQAAVRYQQAKKQSGTHSTKARSEVAGSNRKPFRQKGTGMARRGSNKVAQCRGGGVVFGPSPRSHEFDLPKKVRKLALKTALSSKLEEGKLVIVDKLEVANCSTKGLRAAFEKFGWKSVLFIDSDLDRSGKFFKSVQNQHKFDCLPQIGAYVYDILNHETLVLTKSALEKLEGRLA